MDPSGGFQPIRFDFDAIPAVSPLAIELLALRLETEDAERRLQRIVASDAQLAARLIALANSAAFGLGNIRFATVPLALRRLGLRRAAQFGVAMLFGRPLGGHLPPRLREDLWLRTLALAAAAAEIARLKHLADPGAAHVAGLLHDLAYLAAEFAMPGAIARIAAEAATQGLSIEEAEVRVLGCGHGELTAHLLGHWGVPEAHVGLQRRHHQVGTEPDSLEAVLAGAEKLVRCSELGERLHGRRDHPFAALAIDRGGLDSLFGQQLRLDAGEVERLTERVLAQVEGFTQCARVMAAA